MRTILQSIRDYFFLLLIGSGIYLLPCVSHAQTTFNLSNGQYPNCNTSWSVTGTVYTCTGNGRVTLPNGSTVIANTGSTIVADNGFRLNNNTIGTAANTINLQSDYGSINANGTNTIYGNLQTASGNIELNNTTITGSMTASGGGANILVDGGTVNGAISAGDSVSLEDVNMPSGSIYGAGGVSMVDSTIGSASSPVNVSTNYDSIEVEDSTVYGDLTAPNYSVVNVDNSDIYGNCLPRSNPEGACMPAPPNCPSGSPLVGGIIGQYFNNTSLSGEPINTRLDPQINFDWGNSAPGVTGVNADQFSIRWEGLLRVTQSGNYRFQTSSDDGVRLWVNGSLVINNWTDHSNTTDTSGNVNLTAGETYSIRLEFYENGGQALIRLRWDLPGGGTTYVPIPEGMGGGAGLYHCSVSEICTDVEPSGGIQGEYFNNITMAGTPAGTRVDGPIDFIWNQSAPGVVGVNADEFSIRWNGRLRATVTGNYQFQTRSDDGVRLRVNDQLLIDQWNDHSATDHTSGNVYLVAGQVYPISLEFYERFVDAEIRLRWRVPGSSTFVAIPRGPTPAVGAGLYYCPTAPTVSYYAISHSGTGVTCEAEPITVTAFDANNSPIAPPAGTTAVLATVPATGVWVGGNSYVFSGTETSFIKYLQQLTPATLNINVSDGTSTEIGTADPDIVFSDVGLRFYGDGSLIPLQNQVAGTANGAPIIRAVQTNTDTGACEARVAGTRTVQMSYECVNPSTCVTGQTFTVNGNVIAANSLASPPGSVTNYSNVTLNFYSTGTASIPLNYSDVGMVRLHARLPIAAEGNDPPFILAGSSNTFVVKPHTLAVSAVRNSQGVNNPGTESTGNGFVAAGENFTVEVEARNSVGARTPNFGNETTSERDSVTLAIAELIYPQGGEQSILEGINAGSFSAVTPAGTLRNTTVSWNEVGTIRLQAELDDDDYLGAGDLVELTPSGPIGRFYPDHFELGSVEAKNSCEVFSYMNEGINLIYRVQARSVGGDITTNYHSEIYLNTAESVYHAEHGNQTNLSERVMASASTWTNGVMDFDTSNPATMFTLIRQPTGAPDGPYMDVQLGLSFEDTLDNRQLTNLNMNAATLGDCGSENNCDARQLGNSLAFVYGRMHIKDAFGSENSPLPMFWQTEFWNGNTFVLNAADNCTQLPLTSVSFVDSLSSVNAASDTISVTRNGATSVFNFADPDPANVAGDGLTTTAIGFHNGRAGIQYGAPGAQVTYPILIDLSGLPHLQYDWNQDTNYTDPFLPRVEIRFSNYRGHDRIIYWREDFR